MAADPLMLLALKVMTRAALSSNVTLKWRITTVFCWSPAPKGHA